MLAVKMTEYRSSQRQSACGARQVATQPREQDLCRGQRPAGKAALEHRSGNSIRPRVHRAECDCGPEGRTENIRLPNPQVIEQRNGVFN